MQYPNSDVVDVLHLYEKLTGKKLVMDNIVQGKVNIFIAKPIPREEAIQHHRDESAPERLFARPGGRRHREGHRHEQNPRAAAVPIISDPADLPAGSMVISYLFNLNYADPQELQQVLGQYLRRHRRPASFLALPKSSSLLVTENSDVLRNW